MLIFPKRTRFLANEKAVKLVMFLSLGLLRLTSEAVELLKTEMCSWKEMYGPAAIGLHLRAYDGRYACKAHRHKVDCRSMIIFYQRVAEQKEKLS